MAVTVEELADTGGSAFNQGNQKQKVRRYHVAGIDVSQLELQLAANLPVGSLPRRGDLDPKIPGGLVARGHQIEPIETGFNAIVSIIFATPNVSGTGLLYAVPDLSGNSFVWEETFEDVETIIPVAYKTIHKVSTGSQSQEVKYWEVVPDRVRETRSIIQATWQIGTQNGSVFTQATRNAFENEHGKIHQLTDGYRYLFRIASIRPRDNANYEIRASWTRDKGTPKSEKPSSDLSLMRQPNEMGYWVPSQNAPQNIWPNDANLIRSPFHHLDTVPGLDPGSDDDNLSCPFCIQLKDYPTGNPNNLPAIPLV